MITRQTIQILGMDVELVTDTDLPPNTVAFVDPSTGRNLGTINLDTIRLQCPKCDHVRMVPRFPYDPENAVMMKVTCPKCHQPGTFDDTTYWDADGNQILPK